MTSKDLKKETLTHEKIDKKKEEPQYTLTFLVPQYFQNVYYTLGSTITVPEHIQKAYKGQVNKKKFTIL